MAAVDPPEPYPRPASTDVPTASGRETALVAVAQGLVMVLGAVIALLVAQFFGKNPETDAFFAAYGFYGVGMTFAQTFRLTAVSRLVQADTAETTTRLVGAVVLMSLVVAVPMVALADPLGHVLVASDPTDIAPLTLRILWIALTGQLVAAMLATVLAVRGRFTAIGTATLVAGFISVGVFVAAQSMLGVTAAAVGLVVSAVWLAAAFVLVLARSGWRPAWPPRRELRAMGSEAGRLALASATFFGTTVGYVTCISVAARQGAGQATVFAYGFMLAAVLVGVTANVTAMVRSPALVASSDRARDIAGAALWSFRFTLVLVGPVLALTVLAGRPVIATVLGSAFGDVDVDRIITTLLALVPWVLVSAAAIFAVVELLARGDLRRLALLTAAQVVALPGIAIAGAAVAGLEGIATAFSIVMVGGALAQLRWAFGAAWHVGLAAMARALGRELAVLAIAFAPSVALLAALGDTTLAVGAAAALGAVLVAIASYMAWPREMGALLGLVRRSSRRAESGAGSAASPEPAG